MIAPSMTFNFDTYKFCGPFTQQLEEREQDIKMNNIFGSRPEVSTAPLHQYLEKPQTVNEDSDTSGAQMVITNPFQETQEANRLSTSRG